MKRSVVTILSLMLASAMLVGIFASCTIGGKGDEETTASKGETSGETTAESTTKGSEDTTEETTGEKETEVALEGDYADSISHANKLANGVQTYYNALRTQYTVENLNMTLTFPLAGDSKTLTALTNKNGGVYVQNTMDAFIEMEDGNVYYSSDSSVPARANVYRLGYYYYDVHFLDQNFIGEYEFSVSDDVDMKLLRDRHSSSVSSSKLRKESDGYYIEMKIADSTDPYIHTGTEAFKYSTDTYNAISLSIKSESASSAKLYFVAGSYTDFNDSQNIGFSIENDGEYHEYTIFLDGGVDYTGDFTAFRLDIDGSANETICVKDIKVLSAKTDAPDIVLDRTFHTYSDKLHQALHFVAKKNTTGIASVGLITEVAADTVDKLVVKDAKGLHDTLDGVDWETAEYIGFDIKNVGIFGYVLPVHENSGKLTVELKDDKYVIKQTSSLADQNGTINAPNKSTENDYFMGQRIYTDDSHDFTAFLQEAEWERHPITTVTSDGYVKYDALRGDYVFNIGGTDFNPPFFTQWNYHYSVSASLASEVDRPIYIRTKTSSGCLENAALLSDKDMVLPVLVEVSKNFVGEHEEPIFDAGDAQYGETIFPMVVTADKSLEFTVLNFYQNWGNFPLKQLSSIQYFWPYYHLSVGTTETSCISPWYGARDLWTLPDFRSISMPYWFELEGEAYSNQPQHTHGGYQYFLQYTDSDGNYYASENIKNTIGSSGPVYSEVGMDYISDDGRIKVSYTHLELPQTDELRAYYVINYEILEDITISDFSKDFSFYSFEGYAGYYRKMGYLDANNQIVHKDTNGTATPEKIVLGNNCPYVALYDLNAAGTSMEKNNVNLGFVIYDSNFVIGGEKYNGNFVLTGSNYLYSLSLDLGETTLKAGDTMSIAMIISPWGWYNSTDDSNMQKIRENTCLDPLSVTANDGERLDSTYLPRVLSTNGTSAEFTVSGGTNNQAVRVYGFNKLTVPKIYELVDGEWQEYVVNSANSPDKAGYTNYYDGYYAYYDGNGTYSYAFAFNMDNVDSRTFKIVADEDFKGWPEKEEKPVDEELANVFVPAADIYNNYSGDSGLGNVLLQNDDGDYVRFYASGSHAEAFATLYQNASNEITGQYIFIKYRIPSTNTETMEFQFFTSTSKTGADGNGDYLYAYTLENDDEWHLLIVDVEIANLTFFQPDANGEYSAKYLRFDMFNTAASAESYVDVAYIGMADSIEDICKLEYSMKDESNYVSKAELSQNRNKTDSYDVATGLVVGGNVEEGGDNEDNNEDNTNTTPEYVKAESGKVISEAPYLSRIDFINGFGDGNGAYDNKGGSSRTPNYVDVLDMSGIDIGAQYIVLTGWTMVYGGWDGMVYSVDGGLTWLDASLYNREALSDAYDGLISAAEGATGQSGFAAYKAGCNYQGGETTPDKASGFKADLSAYAGQTVDITFAAVSSQNANELCLVARLENVTVPFAE
ncbi:MAG: hypothetical protein IKL66_01600 [Clostridia bacterium]|nr:hypothetical protein [Clostridia bacterium]